MSFLWKAFSPEKRLRKTVRLLKRLLRRNKSYPFKDAHLYFKPLRGTKLKLHALRLHKLRTGRYKLIIQGRQLPVTERPSKASSSRKPFTASPPTAPVLALEYAEHEAHRKQYVHSNMHTRFTVEYIQSWAWRYDVPRMSWAILMRRARS